MARRRSRKRNGPKGAGLIIGGLALGLFAVGGFAALGWVYVDAKSKHVELNPVNLCPKSGPIAITTVLIDATDEISSITKLDIQNEIRDAVRQVPKHGRLDLFKISPEASSITPMLSVCNPGDANTVDELTGSKQRAQRAFGEKFWGPFNELLENLVDSQAANHSPIIEAVQGASVAAFGGTNNRQVPRRLIVVSDMLQNSGRASFYSGIPSFPAFGSAAKNASLRANLSDVDVELLYVLRDEAATLQGEPLSSFWLSYVSWSGGRVARIVKLTGAS